MKKGQLFILTVVLVSFVLAGMVNLTYYLGLESRTQYTRISPTRSILLNLEKELVLVTNMAPYDEALLEEFIGVAEDDVETRGMELEVQWLDLSDPVECDVRLVKALLTYGEIEGREFNITLRDPFEEEINSLFTVCWS